MFYNCVTNDKIELIVTKRSVSQTPLTNLTLVFLKSCAILFAIWHASLSGSIPTIRGPVFSG